MENNNNNKSKNIEINPIITYNNAYMDKSKIYKENVNKSGIYRLNNLINDKSYVGSSINLNNRLRAYYSISNLYRIVNKEQSMIYKALLKYGHKSFSLDILGYCEPNVLIKREQYYIDLLKPEYNILKFAGSRVGHLASEKTKKAISIALKGKKYKCNEKIAVSKLKYGVQVKVFDKSNNLLFEFPSIKSAARYFYISGRTISNIRNRGKSYDDYIYKFEYKDIRIRVYNNNKELINTLGSKKGVSELYNIPYTTLSRYIKSSKLYNNKYYFHIPEYNTLNIVVLQLANKQSKETKQTISNTLKNRLIKLLPIQVIDINTNITKSFATNLEAAKYLGVSVRTLGRYKSKGKILLGSYKITNNIYNNKSYK
jgi:DNA invertase Pin-like site-specific DNA recombinase